MTDSRRSNNSVPDRITPSSPDRLVIASRCVFAFCALLALLGSPRPALSQESSPQAPIRIPVHAAYSEPNSDGLRLDGAKLLSEWKSADDHLVWYGELRNSGELSVSLSLRVPSKQSVTLRLRLADQTRDVHVEGGDQPSTAEFGKFMIPSAGYQRFEIIGVSKSGHSFGQIESLNLVGPAAAQALFNLKPRRNAASVHLGYPTDSQSIEWFYNEVTVREDPVHSFYMACGFRRGYFGIQVNSPTERRIIFSVWDAGNEAKDRDNVHDADRVKLLAKGDKVVAGDFGGEGTGGHSHLIYDWKPGQPYRFLLTAKPDGDATIYAAYFFFPEKSSWELIASFRAPRDGQYLRGLHSFNENFWGSNGQLQRLAEFGPPWIRTADGQWHELCRARLTHDETGKSDRTDYGAGVIHGHFYLSNGGFTGSPIRDGGPQAAPRAIKFGETVECTPGGKAPSDIPLP